MFHRLYQTRPHERPLMAFCCAVALLLTSAPSAFGIGENCGQPDSIVIGPGFGFASLNGLQTCGSLDDYSNTCLDNYDGGEDYIIQLDVLGEVTVEIQVMSDDPWGGIALDANCPPGPACIAQASSSNNNDVIPPTTLPAGTYYLMVDSFAPPSCVNFDVGIVESAPIIGACCNAGSCTDGVPEGDCAGVFLGPDSTCFPGICDGDDCNNPRQLTLAEGFGGFFEGNTTCGRGNNYDSTCMGSYDDGEDAMYELNIADDMVVNIFVDGLGAPWVGLGLDSSCPLSPSSCLSEVSAGSSTGPISTGCQPLSVGTYYLQVDTFPSPDCIPQFGLFIEECFGACCDAGTCTEGPAIDCAGTFLGQGSTCAGVTCTGGCCVAGVCTDGTTEGTCGGTYLGDEVTCADISGCPPANDDCVNATPVGVGDSPYDTQNATLDESVAAPSDDNMTEDIWFEHTATCDGGLVVETCEGGSSSADTVLEVYSGTCGSLTSLGSSDDDCGSPNAFASTVGPVSVVVGENILIRLSGWNGSDETGSLTVTCLPETGSCCHTDGSCSEGTASDCSNAGGTYQGADSECSTTTCPAACCFDPAGCIPPGEDCWVTECGGGSMFGFGGNPIPAGFFGPGSEPFVGIIELGGPGAGLFGTDTVVRREGTVCLNEEPPSTGTVDIQIVALGLTSCQPITVTYDNGNPDELWDVQVMLSDIPSPPGTMTVDQINPLGGTFDSTFFVRPVFIFSHGTQTIPLDPGIDFPMTAEDVPWVQVSSTPSCGTDFYPGITKAGCCIPTCHEGPSPDHQHCVLPPGCTECVFGGCCLPDGSCVDGTLESECVDDLGGTFAGANSECSTATCPQPAKALPFVSDRREVTGMEPKSTGVGLGRSPRVDHLGRVTDTSTTATGERSNVGESVVRPENIRPDGERIPQHNDPPDDPPRRRDCEPPSGPTNALLNFINNFSLPGGLGFSRTGTSAPLNEYDVGCGVGWNPSLATLIYDPAADQWILIGRDSAVSVFKPDGFGGYTPTAGAYYTLVPSGSSATVIHKSGTTYEFTQRTPAVYLPGVPYLLDSIRDRNGNGSDYAYDVGGHLVAAADTEGRLLTFTHYPDGHIQSIIDPLGRATTYEYTGDQLTAIVMPDTCRIEYTYDPLNRMTSKTSPEGDTYNIAYGPTSVTMTDDGGNPIVAVNNAPTVDTAASLANCEVRYAPGSTTVTDGNNENWIYTYNDRGQILTVTDPLGNPTTLSYDAPTREIAGIEDCRNNTTTYEYDAAGNLTRITDALSNVTQMEYDPIYNQVTRMVEPDLHEWSYNYDATGNLIEVVDPIIELPTDKTVRYEYDASGHRTRATDRNDNVVEYTYTNDLPQTKTVDPGGLNIVTTYGYDVMGRMTSVTNDNGVATTMEYDSINRVTRKVVDPPGLALETIHVYDCDGNLLSTRNPRGTVTSYTYDDRGQRLTMTRDDGGINAVTAWTYDGRGNRITETDPYNNVTVFDYDERDLLIRVTDRINEVTEFEYDCAGNQTRIIDAELRIKDFEYDALNRVTRQIVDPNGFDYQTQIEYTAGACGCGTPGQDLIHKITDADGGVMYQYFDELDRITRKVTKLNDTADNQGDADDLITIIDYDAGNRVVQITEENDPHPDRVTTFDYDAADRQEVRTIDPGGLNLTTTYAYDGVGNVTRQTYENGNVADITFDNANRLETITDSLGSAATYTNDENGNVTLITDPNGNTRSFGYDALDRVTRETDGQGEDTVTVYDLLDRTLSTTDREGETTTFQYDAEGRLTLTGTPLTAPAATSTFTYDGTNRQLTREDAGGGVTTYTYDAAGRLTTTTAPDTSVVTLTYDGRDNLVTKIDGNGDTLNYGYDSANRLTLRGYSFAPSSPAAPTTNETYTYDRRNNMLSADNGSADLDFTYDANSRLLTATQDGAPTSYTYTLPGLGTHRTVNYPSGRSVVEVSDARNRLTAVNEGPDTLAVFQYDQAGRLTTRTYPENGTVTNYTLNANAWTDRLQVLSGGPVVDLEYGRDKEGSPLFVRDHVLSDRSQLLAYDAVNRLTSFERGTLNLTNDAIVTPTPVPGLAQARAWSGLDDVGNWQSVDTTLGGSTETENRDVNTSNQYTGIDGRAQAHDGNGNLLVDSVKGDSNGDGAIGLLDWAQFVTCFDGPATPYAGSVCQFFDYDENGTIDMVDAVNFELTYTGDGVLADGAVRYAYDGLNRLVRVERGGGSTVQYAYDALGRRVQRTEGADTTRYYYGGGRRIMEERDGSNAVEATYVYGHWIDDVISMDRGGQRHYYHRDATGNTVACTDIGGAVVERYTYDPYGRTTITDAAGTPQPTSSIDNPYRYGGRRYDEAARLYHYRSRDYDPARGRFLSRDPLGHADGDNLYQYVNGRPTMLGDPFGFAGSGETCRSIKRTPLNIEKEGSVGPISWEASISFSLEGKACLKCCPEGTPRACQWVVDASITATLSASAGGSGSSYGGELGPFGFWAGIRIEVGISGTATGTFASDKCNGDELTGTLCIDASGTISVSGGAKAYVDTWLGEVAIGAYLTGSGSVTVHKCLVCSSAGCSWQPGKLCLSASVTINVDALIISGSWEIWSGRKCWTI